MSVKPNMLLYEIARVARACGDIIRSADRDSYLIDSKAGHGNFVTTYDKMIEQKLKAELKELLPDALFVGEEGDTADDISHGDVFIVDPIDGTMNFIRDYPVSCVSIGLLRDGEPFIGVVYQPFLDEMYIAERGKGAFLNGKPIHVSDNDLADGLVLFGTAPYYKEMHETTMAMALDYLNRCLDLRRSGSAVYDICSVAAGRAELFFEMKLYPWDYAAASVILSEAGGVLTTLDGAPVSYEHPCSALAKNKASN